jgi:hypothetical protein
VRAFRTRVLAALLAVGVTAGAALTACAERAEREEPLRPGWHEVTLPVPAGTGRAVPREAAECGGRWYVVGAVAAPDGATAPAAWTSADARTWTAMTVRPHTFYGRQNVLYTVACRDGRVAAVGGKVGGAHGNPRVSSWHQRDDGSLDEVLAGFELYGGPYAVNVARLTAGPPGWLIVGNRISGAAVWVSPDSAEFRIVEGAPGLASDEAGETWGFDAAPVPGGWLTVGGLILHGRSDRDPLAWTSPDGRTWTRTAVPGTEEYDELQRVVLADGTPVAVGLRGRAFGAWRRDGDRWVSAGGFGAPADGGVPAVRGLAATAGGVLAATSDGRAHALWLSPDRGGSWRDVSAPVAMPAGADKAVALAAGAARVLLLVDDGRAGRAWIAPAPLGDA